MREFHVEIAIRAPAERVWSILVDLPAWPSWNSSVVAVEGTIAPGAKITVRPKLDPRQAFPVRVAALEPPRRMVWRGGLPAGFLFKGVRTFELTPRADGDGVDFRMHERFSGLMAPLITRSIPDLQPAFDELAGCLKRRAEGATLSARP